MASVTIDVLSPRAVGHGEVEKINLLQKGLDPEATAMTKERVALVAERSRFMVARLGGHAIVGMATLIPHCFCGGFLGVVEGVVVLEGFRGQGIGRKLMHAVIQDARWQRMERLELTSRPHREAAHALYKSPGFRVDETTCFYLDL